MWVRLNVGTSYQHTFLAPGDVVNVATEQARRWVLHGIADAAIPPPRPTSDDSDPTVQPIDAPIPRAARAPVPITPIITAHDCSLIVPYRPGQPDRERIHDWCLARYAHLFPDAEIILADAGGEIFSRGRSINDGAARSTRARIVILDNDYLFDGLMAYGLIMSAHPWTLGAQPREHIFIADSASAHNVLSQSPTDVIDLNGVVTYPNPYPLYGSIIALPRAHFIRFDPEMAGYGWEDNVWYWCMCAVHGEPHRTENRYYHIYHDRPANSAYMRKSFDNKSYFERVWEPIIDDREAMLALMRAKEMWP
jgi:hypothetical protein